MTPEQERIHDEAARYWAAQPPHSSPLDDDDQPRGMYTAAEWVDEITPATRRRWVKYFASLLCVAQWAVSFALTFAGVAVVAALV